MIQEIEVKRLTIGTIFKLLLSSLLLSITPLVVLEGILEVMGVLPKVLAQQAGTSSGGVIISNFFVGIIFSFVCAFSLSFFIGIGHWLYSRFKTFVVRFYALTPEELAKIEEKERNKK